VNKTKRLFIIALFGSIIFVTSAFVPFPIDRMLIIVEAVLLALSALFISKLGATYVGAVGGLLSSLWGGAFFPFTFIFTFLYGVLVDVSFFLFKINPKRNGINQNRIMLAMTFSTAIVGFLSYYTTVIVTEIVPRDPVLEALILFIAITSGAIAGYAASYLWNKFLKNLNL